MNKDTLPEGEFPFDPIYKVPITLYMMGDLPTSGLRTLVRTSATPYMTELWLETMGLRWVPVLWISGNP